MKSGANTAGICNSKIFYINARHNLFMIIYLYKIKKDVLKSYNTFPEKDARDSILKEFE